MEIFEQDQICAAASNGFYSAQAERAALGAVVGRYDRYSYIVSDLSEEDFYDPAHQTIFRAIKRVQADGFSSVDFVTVSSLIDKLDPLRARDINALLIWCVKDFAKFFQADSYSKIIKELSLRRKAIAMIGNIQRQLKDPTQPINGIMDSLRTQSSDMVINKHAWTSMQDVMMYTYEWLEKRVKGEITSITTGIPNVDAIIGGFFGGEMTIIGARPGVGKSVFGMNVAMAAAGKGFHVAICSREMTDIQYGQRIISYEGYVDGMKLRKAEIGDDDWAAIVEAINSAAEKPIDFLFTVRTVEDLRAEVQRKIARGKLDMLIVDYLQLMGNAQRFKEDRLRVAYISKALKDIAVDFNIPVIALAQVKRYSGGARAKMPTLEDLKDSGNLEQDADGVIFLHKPYDAEDEYVDPRDKPYFDAYAEKGFSYLCLGIAKQRQGSTGKSCVLFHKKTMRYYAIDRNR